MNTIDEVEVGDWVRYLDMGDYKVIRISLGNDRLLLGDDSTDEVWTYGYGYYKKPEGTFWADPSNCTKLKQELTNYSKVSEPNAEYKCICDSKRLVNLGHETTCEWAINQIAVLGEE